MKPESAQRSARNDVRPLGGGEIGRCLTRIHHDRFTAHLPADEPDEVRMRARALGVEFEDAVVAQVVGAVAEHVRIDTFGEAAVDTTTEALTEGVPLIVGGRLVGAGGRHVGVPDLLVRFSDGYAPIEIKRHFVRSDKGIPARTSAVTALTAIDDIEVRFRSRRRRDLLQAEHYRRLLQGMGFASPQPLVGVIGNDDPLVCHWVDPTSGNHPVSGDYDAYVAHAEQVLTHGTTHRSTPLVDAWLRGECATCDWYEHCMSGLELRDDVTLLRDVDDEVRAMLAASGVATVAHVAALDMSDERLPAGSVVLQARARTAGQLLRADDGKGALALPTTPVEVDLDIETMGGRTYLAGLLITEGGESRYEPIADWSGTMAGEGVVLGELFDRLAAWSRAGAIVYHWTDYEQRMLAAAGHDHGLTIDGFASVDAWFDAHAFDLCAWSRRTLTSPNGYSLKTIAPLCGFTWRDADPGGLQSEIWFERLLAGEDEMKDRLLTYNEDDVLAQLAVRTWVRSHDAGAGPGSSIPSALQWPIPRSSTPGN